MALAALLVLAHLPADFVTGRKLFWPGGDLMGFYLYGEPVLDFAPLVSSGDPPTSVLAAAITPELLKTIREVCQAAHLTPKHLVLRPFAARLSTLTVPGLK